MEHKFRELLDTILENRTRRAIALTLAIIVTFTTTYSLVLPAITLEKDTAETMSGVSLGGNDQEEGTSVSSEETGPDETASEDRNADIIAFDAEAKNEGGETEALVHVEADTDAFPPGTIMEAKAVTDQDVLDNITEAAEGEVVAVHAVDIAFTDENGEKVLPSEGSQVSVTLSAGDEENSDTQNKEAVYDSDNRAVKESEEVSADQTTESTVIQYTEDSGAEPVETKDDVSLRIMPETDLDQENAVSFDMSGQTGEQDSQTFAIVKTVTENDVKGEDFTEQTEEPNNAPSEDVIVPGDETVAGPERIPPELDDAAAVEAATAEEETPDEVQELPPEEPPAEDLEVTLTAQDENETYLVTMICGPEANIPAGASLQVEEIVSEAQYDDHLEKTQIALNEAAQTEAMEEDGIYAGPAAEEPRFFSARSLMSDPEAFDRQQAEAASAPETEIVYARFFDITILDADGEEYPPQAPVRVSIQLLDTEQQDEQVIQNADAAQVIHFGEEKTEVMQAETLEDTVAGVAFDAESFSVYGVVYTVVIGFEDDGVYRFRGEDYTVTLTCPEEAQIPEGTELTVSEVDPDSDEYIQRLGQAWYEVNREYFEVKEMRANYNEGMGDLPDLPLVNLDRARFFTISLVYEDEEIEPGVPVQIEIAYDDGMTMAGEAVSGVVHYTKDAVEVDDEADTVKEGSDVLAFKYEQESFSDTGTYVGQKTYDEIAEPVALPAPTPMDYPLLQTKKMGSNALREIGNGENGDGGSESSDELPKPKATKTLTPNESNGINDGTYTLELAVDGHAKSSTETTVNKSNVLIVMDRSSSMINNITGSDVTQVAWYSYGGWNQPPLGYYQYGSYNNNSWSPTEGVTYYGHIESNGEWRYRELFYNNGQFYYYDSQGVTTATTRSYTGDIFTSKTRTRLDEEQEALATLIRDLLAKNGEGTTDNGVSLEDIIEISVISFAKDRMDENDGTAHPDSEQDWSTTYADLMKAVNDPYAPSGTNWEQALRYAMDKINQKKLDPKQYGEDYYLLFLTDGEPTATQDHHSNAYYYDGSSHGGFDNAFNPARNYVRDESGIAAAEDIHFYGIMTWGTNETMRGYLKRLVNVGNGNVTNETVFTTEAVDEDGVDDYYYDADSLEKLEDAFNNIFNLVSNNLAYEQVSITDGLTTDAMTTTLVTGSTKGYKYTVYKDRVVDDNGNITNVGTPVYTVTAGDNGNVTFTIDGQDYPAGDPKSYTYNELQDNGTTTEKTKHYYSVTVGGVEYKMTLADKDDSGLLTWDLAALGSLVDGYTYAVSFVVWPDQDAYDYVAALNNGLSEITDSHGDTVTVSWNSSVETSENLVTDSNGNKYWPGGVEKYPSIVKYTDGTFAVLTNTEQSLKYTVAKTKTENGQTTTTYEGPFTPKLPSPNPMPLTASSSQVEKVWNINRDPDILAQLLYGDPENPYSIGFDIFQDEDSKNPYTSVRLGWDSEANDGDGAYIWKSEDKIYVKWDETKHKYVTCSSEDEGAKEIGTHWADDFSIATGLMLSEARMTALGLDKTAYTWTMYPEEDGTKYYLLEEGHDYTISEPNVGYEFDFDAPVYHPMLVDGVLMNVDVEDIVKNQQTGKVTSYNITGMTPLNVEADGTSALTVVNTLRGYLNVEKRVLDNNGDENPSDDTEFEFTITLSNNDGLFEGDHIPWFAVNDCFYHTVDEDGEWHYYQVDKVSVSEAGTIWRVITEKGSSGPTYTFTSDSFDEDVAGKQTITCTNINDANDTITLEIYGNQTTPDPADSKTTIKLTRSIRQDQKLTIGNVPAGSKYTVGESGKYGYELKTTSGNTSGTIVPNSDTNVVFTNQKISTDVDILKNKETGKGLSGAIFQLRAVSNGSEVLASVEIGGIEDFSKEINGKKQDFTSAFETTGEIHSLTNLPDGTYRLYEVYVPAGYVNTLPYIEFVVDNGTVSCSMAADEEKVDFNATGTISLITITNTPGAALPNTGGPGTRLFTILGSILTAGAAAISWKRWRTR